MPVLCLWGPGSKSVRFGICWRMGLSPLGRAAPQSSLGISSGFYPPRDACDASQVPWWFCVSTRDVVLGPLLPSPSAAAGVQLPAWAAGYQLRSGQPSWGLLQSLCQLLNLMSLRLAAGLGLP